MNGVYYVLFVITEMLNIITGSMLPGKPMRVTVLADSNNIAVQWEPPLQTDGNIRKYIVTWAILPNMTDVSSVVVDGDATIAFISVHGYSGRLFRVRVRAQNDAGIGPYSTPRFIRIACGYDLIIQPNDNFTMTSPGFENGGLLQPGIVCKWTIATVPKYSLKFAFLFLDLNNKENTVNSSNNCNGAPRIDISGVGLFCDADVKGSEIPSDTHNATVLLTTGTRAGGRGFSLQITSVVKLPGPPTHIRTIATHHAIIITWQPPTEVTFPITSYTILYSIPAKDKTIHVRVDASMRQFAINTDRYAGRIVVVRMSAAIGDLAGEMSRPRYTRAPCHKNIVLQAGQTTNITSPNYPDKYPSSIVCTWSVRAEPEVMLRMTLLDFRVEDTSFCSSDYVRFSFRPEPECARMDLPRRIETQRSNFTLTFVTDSRHEFAGFLILVQAQALLEITTSQPINTTGLDTTLNTIPTLTRPSPHIQDVVTITRAPPTQSQSHGVQTSTRSPETAVKQSSEHTAETLSPSTSTTQGDSSKERTSESNSSSIQTPTIDMTTQEMDIHTNTTPMAHTLSTPVVEIDVTNAATTQGTLEVHPNIITTVSVLGLTSAFTPTENVTGPGALTEDRKTGKSGKTGNIVAPVISVVAVLVIVVCLTAVICLWRRRRSRQKIHVQEGTTYRQQQHIELHDILLHSNSVSLTGFSPFYPQLSATLKRRSSFPCCYSLRKSKILARRMDKSLAALEFIEDREALKQRLQLMHRPRRMNSI